MSLDTSSSLRVTPQIPVVPNGFTVAPKNKSGAQHDSPHAISGSQALLTPIPHRFKGAAPE
ncbi:hypothetical protein [Cognatiyoonia koreensis]|uniref:hypothetical protein n=1 Tax=Cognatiyoonia koreensis TaxID=364200 RepID=UPI0013F4FB62|nr:hypothetical protein [Cognatiyoonia koreensis]